VTIHNCPFRNTRSIPAVWYHHAAPLLQLLGTAVLDSRLHPPPGPLLLLVVQRPTDLVAPTSKEPTRCARALRHLGRVADGSGGLAARPVLPGRPRWSLRRGNNAGDGLAQRDTSTLGRLASVACIDERRLHGPQSVKLDALRRSVST